MNHNDVIDKIHVIAVRTLLPFEIHDFSSAHSGFQGDQDNHLRCALTIGQQGILFFIRQPSAARVILRQLFDAGRGILLKQTPFNRPVEH